MIRIAAAGDIHFDRNSDGKLGQHLKGLEEKADCLLLAGDLTQTGSTSEALVLAQDLKACPVPVIATLGNHDYHVNQVQEITQILTEAGVHILERGVYTFEVRGVSVGIVGLKGFGGGFIGACASEFGEPEMKSFIQFTKAQAAFLEESLAALKTTYRIALLHYSPVAETLLGERKEIYPFLGSYLLGEAIDDAGADLVFHGHAHKGVEKGITPGGIPVRNVAQHVIRHAFNIYLLNKDGVSLHGQQHANTEKSPGQAPPPL